MARKIIWTEKASSDIEAIIRYISRRVPDAATRIGLGIYERAQLLLHHPDAGSPLKELSESGWRKLIYRRGKIIYRIHSEDIIVGRVWSAELGEADFETPL